MSQLSHLDLCELLDVIKNDVSTWTNEDIETNGQLNPVVRVVSDTDLYCSPVGTFREDHPLHESKFELLLVRPNHQSFGPDYDLTTKQLSIAQHGRLSFHLPPS
jgi:hypothetical protein